MDFTEPVKTNQKISGILGKITLFNKIMQNRLNDA